ncbi:hypothetical protein JQ617_03380 [Bradyrhizobium sp. KB893862 SZCCT0404]|uniref:hypothetical protein n=1 Tax=Bradyrhizobium sp. KB893862 SZCCT0404 TaxID=2807672 RepID=UPI001BA5517C|nr:hypothetical protein [Bradyrhizobium sp. KB893862 SZCCT0404]MBR1172987.1 hypothetical protein [Bradyrhizobium sp. KB893862 SZCCT0404]
MTEQAAVDLFALADAYAAEHLLDPLVGVDEYRAFFYGLMKLHRQDLNDAERDILFEVWREKTLGALRMAAARQREHMVELERQRLALFGADRFGRAFMCACGEMLADGFDVETIRKHRPHMIAAGVLRND